MQPQPHQEYFDWKTELANSLTHGVGLVLSIAGLALLVTFAAIRGTAWHVVSCAIYGTTLVLLYAASTFYHSFRKAGVRRVFRILDHCCIYLLIAGTYTPFLLVSLRSAGPWIWVVLVLMWALTLAGIFIKAFFTGRFTVISTLFYIGMGWIAIFILKPMLEHLPLRAIFWLLAGGLSYTFGTLFFGWIRLRMSHTIWHLFVMLGSACHFAAVYFYVLPR